MCTSTYFEIIHVRHKDLVLKYVKSKGINLKKLLEL